jgi:O-antigen/teichoic acid export membrane protein
MSRSAVALGLIRFSGLALAVLMNVAAARLLDPAGFGTLVFLLSLVTLLSSISSGGLTSLLTRDVANASTIGAATTGATTSSASPVFLWVTLTSLALAALFLLVSTLGLVPRVPTGYASFAVGVALLGLGLLNVLSGIWRGLGSPAAGDMPIAVVIPAVFLAVVLGLSIATAELSVMLFFAAYVGAIWAAAAGSVMLLRRRGPSIRMLLGGLKQPLSRRWFSGFWPFLSLGTLMVGLVADETSTAFFRVAERMAVLVSLPLVVLNAVIASGVVRSHAAGDTTTLMTLVRRARRVALAGALPLGLVMIVFGDEIIGVMFGPEYVDGARIPLIILVLGQWINVACGSVGLVLSMCGHEKTVLREQTLALGIAGVSLPPVILVAGVTGASVVMAVALALWNLRLLGAMRRQLMPRAQAS